VVIVAIVDGGYSGLVVIVAIVEPSGTGGVLGYWGVVSTIQIHKRIVDILKATQYRNIIHIGSTDPDSHGVSIVDRY
jgi:hypothetical protein